ncbi:MAG: hypothetical protein ACT4P7_06350 [Gemmatimonadaceae bacterium]
MTDLRAVYPASWRRTVRGASADSWWNEWRHVLGGAWRELRGALRVQVGTMTRDDVTRVIGYRQQLVGMLQRHYREGRATVEQQVDVWLCHNAPQLFSPLLLASSGDVGSRSGTSNMYAENHT